MCCVDGQERGHLLHRHSEGPAGHEGIPDGAHPNARPATLLLHGRDRGSQAHPEGQPDTGMLSPWDLVSF